MYLNYCRYRRYSKIIPRFPKLLFLFFILNSFAAKAQFSYGESSQKFGVGINADYDMPAGSLKYTYKAAPAYGASFYIFNENWTANVSAGYRVYKPKQDVFYYAVGDNDYGTATYGNFRSYMLYLGGAYNFEISDGFRVFAGVNLGAYATKFFSHSVDAAFDKTEDINEQELYGAPKAGINLSFGENLQLNIQGSYNFFATTGQTYYNSRTCTLYKSISTGAGLIYKF
jgi:hypothetical protein